MGGDRQSTWEHMAPNKQQAMCSTHRDIWWPAWAHQQDRDIRNVEVKERKEKRENKQFNNEQEVMLHSTRML